MRMLLSLALGTCLIAAPASAVAQTTTSTARVTITGWHLDCNPASGKLTCRILDQVSQAPNGGLLLGLTLVSAPKGATEMTLQVPLGVALGSPIAVSASAGVSQNFPFLTCSQQGCFATAAIAENVLTAMRAGKADMQATYTILDGNLAPHTVTVSLPLSGFSEVYDKLRT